MDCQIVRPTPKPQDLYDNQKKDMLTNDGGTKIWSFTLYCGSIDVIIKIYSNYVMSEENINFRKKKGVDIEH